MASTSKNIEQRGYSSGRELKEDDHYINKADWLYMNQTALAQSISVIPHIQFSYKSAFPISTQRDVLTEINGGTVTKQNGSEFRVRATSTTGSIAGLTTKQFGDYLPEHIFMPSEGVRVPTQPTGNAKVLFGYGDYSGGTVSNGNYLEYNSTGLYHKVMSGSVEKHSELIDVDVAKGNIFRLPFLFYGYGFAGVDVPTLTNGSLQVERKSTYYPNGEILFERSNMPLFCIVEADGTQLDAYVGGRQMSVIGNNDRIFRSSNAVRKNVGSIGATNYYPMVSVRQNTSLDQIYIELGNVSAIADADMEFAIFRNGTLTGDNFGTPEGYNSGEVATQWDVSATAITGGEKVYGDIMQGGTGTKANFTAFDLPDKPVVDGDEWSFCLRRISGTNATATLSASARENW